MRKIVVSTYVTLDGVVESPEKWFLDYWSDETAEYANAQLFGSDGLLLGRVTYQGFAEAWPSRDGDFADRINSLPKFVVSSTLDSVEWSNSTLIGESVAAEISSLKEEPGRDLLMYGSPGLMHTLTRDGLVDEFRFWVVPVVLGSGKRLFADGARATLELMETTTFDTGVVVLSYRSR